MPHHAPIPSWRKHWECFPALIVALLPLPVVGAVVYYAVRLADLGYSAEAIGGAVAALAAAIVYVTDHLLRRLPRRRPRSRR